MSIEVCAPLAGKVIDLDDVPDPVFAGRIVGPGVAIDPTREGDVEVVAPISGTIVKFHPHAFVVASASGSGVLVHLGIDTVQLEGEGFTLHAEEGQQVNAGDLLVTWNPGDIAAGGRSPIVPIITLDASEDPELLVACGEQIDGGAPLLSW